MENEQLPAIEELVGQEVSLERDSVQNFYRSSYGGINPDRWERANNEILFQDVVAELTGHRDTVIRCPFHGRDRTPSFTLYSRTNDAYCFGCLDLDEPIWTSKGLMRIGDVWCGDEVLDRYGRRQLVYAKEYKTQKTLYAVETDNFRKDPLLLTGGHTCIFVRFCDAEKYLPFIVKKRGFRNQEKFSRKSGQPRKFRERVFSVPIVEGPTTEMAVGDYLLFPIIGDAERTDTPLGNDGLITTYSKGPTPHSVPTLPVTVEACRLYGLYIAEGSVNPSNSPRTVRWTFNINESKSLATYVKLSLGSIFGLDSTLTLYPKKNTCEVTCSSTELARSFSFWFGKGAANKTIPPTALWWTRDIQGALIRGYMEGDGDHNTTRKAATISRILAYALFAMGIQAGMPMSLGRQDSYTDRMGIFHQEAWSVYIRKQERIDGFFHRIKNHNYYWSRVSKIIKTRKRRRVVDISVWGSESFVTKMGAVHNCPPGSMLYDNVTFVSKYMELSRVQALYWLEKTFNLPSMPNVLVDDEEEEGGTLGFWDLAEHFILKAQRDVQETKDVELAEDYTRIYFTGLTLEKSAKDAERSDEVDPDELHLQATVGLAEVLGKEELAAIADGKVI